MTDQKLVLVVEDDPTFRMLLQEVLTLWGYRVILCGDGEEGVQTFARHVDRIHAVLLDMIMPKKSGKQTFQEIRDMDATANVIILTGYSMESTVEALLDDGAIGLLHKPFEISDLHALMQSISPAPHSEIK